MGHYIKLSLKEAQDILSLYNVQDVLAIDPQSLGISNTNYKITTAKETLLLKVSNDKDIEQLSKEQEILHFLKQRKFPLVLAPLALQNGGHVYEYHSLFGVIYPFLEGKAPKISTHSCHEIGKALGSLHLLSRQDGGLSSKIRHCSEVGYDANKIIEYVAKSPLCPDDFRQGLNEAFPHGPDDYLRQNFECGLIHGDLYYDNTLFMGDRLVTLLDFEQAGIGDFLFDLGVSISGTCLDRGRIDPALVATYLEGYQTQRILPEAEKRFLKEAILIGLLSISLWRIKRFTEGDLDPLKNESYRELLLRARQFQDISIHPTP